MTKKSQLSSTLIFLYDDTSLTTTEVSFAKKMNDCDL